MGEGGVVGKRLHPLTVILRRKLLINKHKRGKINLALKFVQSDFLCFCDKKI